MWVVLLYLQPSSYEYNVALGGVNNELVEVFNVRMHGKLQLLKYAREVDLGEEKAQTLTELDEEVLTDKLVSSELNNSDNTIYFLIKINWPPSSPVFLIGLNLGICSELFTTGILRLLYNSLASKYIASLFLRD